MQYSTFEEINELIRLRLDDPLLRPNQLDYLPRARYQQMLEVLHEALHLGVADRLKSGIKRYFIHRWASRYYCDIFEWTLHSADSTDRINHERALQLTYSKKHAHWTLTRLLTIPPSQWPSSIFRLLIRDLGRLEELMNGIFQLADASRNDVYILWNLISINDDELLMKIDSYPSLPRLIRRKLDVRLGKKKLPKVVKVLTRDLNGFEHRWSAEVDDYKIAATIIAGCDRLMWRLDEECKRQLDRLDEDSIPDRGRVLLLSPVEDGEVRWVVGEREDSTTVILLFLSKAQGSQVPMKRITPIAFGASRAVH
jgi:hypothetical protein